MRNKFFIIATTFFATALLFSNAEAQNRKLAQTGMKFLNVGAGAEATGMAEAVTSIEGSSVAMFYNPAGMARISSTVDATVGQTNWIADINHKFASIAFSPSQGDYGVIGINLQFVDYGTLQGTIRANNTDGYLETGNFTPSASSIGVSYARALSDRFSVGGNMKYVTQDLGTTTISVDANGNAAGTTHTIGKVVVFDFGTLYRTGFKSLNFGVAIRNFSREVKYERENFQLPLIFKIGISMNAMDFLDVPKETQSFVIGIDATHPRDFPEQINIGGEYSFMKMLAVRAGYMFNNDEYGFTGGVGVQAKVSDYKLGFDYSYTPFGVFDQVHRISVTISLF